MKPSPILTLVFIAPAVAFGQIERVWLTNKSTDPSRLVVNWETATPADSIVHFGLTSQHVSTVSQHESVTLHHVEIPTPLCDVVYHYSVRSGMDESPDYTFRGYPTGELRVAVVADLMDGKANLEGLKP